MKTLELHYTGNDPIVSKCTIHIDLVTSQHKNNESLNKVIHSFIIKPWTDGRDIATYRQNRFCYELIPCPIRTATLFGLLNPKISTSHGSC